MKTKLSLMKKLLLGVVAVSALATVATVARKGDPKPVAPVVAVEPVKELSEWEKLVAADKAAMAKYKASRK